MSSEHQLANLRQNEITDVIPSEDSNEINDSEINDGIDLEVTISDTEKTELFNAVIAGDLEQLKKILEQDKIVKNLETILYKNAWTVLILGLYEKRPNIIEYILQVVERRRLETKQLVNTGVKNTGGYTPLILALVYGYVNIVMNLLRLGATLEGDKWHVVGANSSKKCLQFLVKWYIDRGDRETNSVREGLELMMEGAAVTKNWEVVKWLLKDVKVDINSKRKLRPVLLHAAFMQDMEMVTWLVENGADVNVSDKYGRCILHYELPPDVTLYILDHGASLSNTTTPIIKGLSSDVLQTHLDNCITIKATHIDSPRHKIEINYVTILPPIDTENIGSEEYIPEFEVPYHISQSKYHRHLLKHPVISAFIMVKWSKLKWFYYINLIFFVILCVTLASYILFDYNNNNLNIISVFLYTLLVVEFILLLIREIFQIFINFKKYINSAENYAEISLLINMVVILFCNTTHYELHKHSSAISFLCMSFSLTLLLGQYPKFSIVITMLRTVTYSFFRHFLLYLIIILSFSLSFYTLFSDHSNDKTFFFNTKFMSFFKVIVMMSGELEAGNINYNKHSFVSVIIFAMFVFMIPIIMLNLLNGLAVSDTQLIRKEAEIIGYVSQIEYINYIERLFKIFRSLNISRAVKDFINRLIIVPCTYFNSYSGNTSTIKIPIDNKGPFYKSSDVGEKLNEILRKKRETTRLSNHKKDSNDVNEMLNNIMKKVMQLEKRIQVVQYNNNSFIFRNEIYRSRRQSI